MIHCHMSIMCNELPFLIQKLSFMYKHFNQLIFIDYDIFNKCNSTDGSIKYIQSFPDPENKIKLIIVDNLDNVNKYHGQSFVEKQKMFAIASQYVKDETDLIWATDLDEFFHDKLILNIEQLYENDKELVSVDIPHLVFVYNQYNVFNKKYYICPRITKHVKGRIYGHCNFHTYGKTVKYEIYNLFHFAFIGYNRCMFKAKLYQQDGNVWLAQYLEALKHNKKYVNLGHPGGLMYNTINYDDCDIPDYIDINKLIIDLNIY